MSFCSWRKIFWGASGASTLLGTVALGTVALADYPFRLSETYAVGDQFMHVRLLGTVHLPARDVNGFGLVELSGLAWDEDEGVLLALSDHARVFRLAPVLVDGFLVDVEVLGGFALSDRDARALSGTAADAEGLALANDRNGVHGDTELVVSFERIPRVERFGADGRWEHSYRLPPALARASAYRSPNKGLESVVLHPELGVLTAPEWPTRETDRGWHVIYALDGRQWRFERHRAPNSSLVDLELCEDGSVLTLERSFSSVWQPLVIALRRSPPLANASEGGVLPMRDVAVFNSFEGWRVDNFEGLARHRGMRFFAVSDDNENLLQKTLLLYFELSEGPPDSAAIPDLR